ncbi:MAG: ChaN family lipoprotein [Planctomycetes bacterium]|nr:ChaN family lipoprotein [Planctomycetota bacterium]
MTPTAPVHVLDVGVDVRSESEIIDPVTNQHLRWSSLLEQIDEVDVVLLGEQHDHAIGHALQLAIVEDVMDKYPCSVLALEMLERDEQLKVDDYMEDFIDAKTFASLTFSKNWGGSGGWEAWYQPIIDAVKNRGGSVVAANAPRRYVRLARLEGYERIDELPQERRKYIDYPEVLSDGKYRQRFWELASHDEDDEEQVEIDVTNIDPNDPMLPTFKSMQSWDATMAQSIVSANPSKECKVILLVGQFHVEYDGGIVQELRRRMPSANVLVVSIQRELPEEEWRGAPAIADIMIIE